MRVFKFVSLLLPSLLALPCTALAQTAATLSSAATAATAVPPLIPYSGQIQGLSGHATATFLLYKDETGGEPLFAETQTVVLDSSGRYQVQLGATLASGLPTDLFATGEARWLEVQIAGEAPRARVPLVSVPYALKAADAATLGGLPASAFALRGAGVAGGVTADSGAASPPAALSSTVTTPGGTSGYLPVFTGAATIGDSIIFQNSNGIGINNIPYAALDVTGKTVIRGNLDLGRTGNPTTATGFPTYPLTFHPGAYSTGINAAVYPVFQWQAEPLNNNTANPSATFNLLTAPNSSSTPSETGFHFNLNGTMTFASGQTFPGSNITGGISATSVNSTTIYELGGALFATGSAANGSAYLGFAGNTSSTGLRNTGVGYQALSAITTGYANTGTGYEALQSNATGYSNTANGSGSLTNNTEGNYNTGVGQGTLFSNITGSSNTASGAGALTYNTTGSWNTASGSAALLLNTAGNDNTASGFLALYSNTTGSSNIADGDHALYNNTTGNENTAVGVIALYGNTTGSDLTALGYSAGPDSSSSSLTNATAIGAYTEITESNTLVLGCIAGKNNCPASVSVGIGTTTPDNLLTVNGTADKPGGGSWGTYSDVRLKTVQGGFGGGLNQVMQLRPIRYRYKPDNALGIRDADEHIGVVAQEVQRVIPEAVTENSKGYLIVNNDPVIWSMVNAIKEQQEEIEEQRKLIREQSRAMKSLTAQVRETRKALRQVKEEGASGPMTMVAAK